jgi:acetylglutamate kinase
MLIEALRHVFARNMVLLKCEGVHPVIVHGSEPQIDATMQRMGMPAHAGCYRKWTRVCTP